MRTVTDCVRTIVQKSPFVHEPLRLGWLNLSQYATSIKPEVENMIWKKVQLGSIITALGRIRAEISEQFSITLAINDIALKFPITEFNFGVEAHHKDTIALLYKHFTDIENSFLNIISGNTETGIFINSQHAQHIITLFTPQKPNLEIHNLGAVSIKFDPQYLQTIGSVYHILKSLVWHKINITEVISTYTELTLIVAKSDVQQVFDVVTGLMDSVKSEK